MYKILNFLLFRLLQNGYWNLNRLFLIIIYQLISEWMIYLRKLLQSSASLGVHFPLNNFVTLSFEIPGVYNYTNIMIIQNYTNCLNYTFKLSFATVLFGLLV